MFRNIPPVTKNLLLLNIMFFVVSVVLAQNGTDISRMLGAHYFNSFLFQPFQIVTHMFMHSITDFFHILFNMLLLVMFGGHLERIWGSKRYFIFYIACGLGAIVLYNSIGMFQIYELKNALVADGYDLRILNNQLAAENFDSIQIHSFASQELLQEYINLSFSTLVGASGAVFGLLAGFAMLFPNTELMLLFPPIPIKAKYLIGGYLAFEIYSSIYRSGDQIAHLAHVGGAVVGIIIILIWRKRDRSNFY
ncbi:MAG: rhomboid family intramembrane serine protease [Crocinitomicaceae bacterium]|jgi:membrane associated rhomboid family serine protease|nr:rhomboid family intramembrane serine protease [Crocinitomicaceae bacterium]